MTAVMLRPRAGDAVPRRRGRRRLSPAYAFLLPGFAVFTLVMLVPTVEALWVSLHEWSVAPGGHSVFIGAGNYLRALGDPIFWRAVSNGGIYVVGTVVPQLLLGLLLAIALDRPLRGRAAFRALVYVPVISSWVVVSLLFRYLFGTEGGAVNYLLTDVVRVVDQPVDWLGGRTTAMGAIILLGLWKGVGWAMLIFLAALQSVPVELRESASIDGAGPFRRFLVVTVPSIRRTVVFVSVLLVIGGFNVFVSVHLMTDGGPSDLTQVPLTYLYRQAFNFLDFGYGSSIAFLLTALMLGLTFLQLRLTRNDDAESPA